MTDAHRRDDLPRALALARRDDVCLSTQVMGEFYRAVTSSRRARPLTHDQAVARVQLRKRHDVRPLSVPHVDLALELKGRYRTAPSGSRTRSCRERVRGLLEE